MKKLSFTHKRSSAGKSGTFKREAASLEASNAASTEANSRRSSSTENGPELENALQIKSWTLAKKCIAQGFGTNVKGVFHLAIRQGAPADLIEILLKLNPSVVNEPQDSYEGNWFPLLLAIRSAPHVLPCLLAVDGINPNCLLSTGENPVLLACREGAGLAVIKTLVEAGSSVNIPRNDGMTALIVSTLRDEAEQVAFLLESGANANAVVTADGTSALLFASYKTMNSRIVELLLLAGADANLAQKSGETPVFALIESSHATSLENARTILELLIQAGADVNQANAHGETPLCIAAEKNVHPSLMALLIRAGADVNKSSDTGMTPILLAVVRGVSKDLVELLLENGAVIASKFQNQSALQIAQARGFAHLIDVLERADQIPQNILPKIDALKFTFCTHCRKRGTALYVCRKCGLAAYCRDENCEAKDVPKHFHLCQAAQQRLEDREDN